jgi:hypothetical protein
MSQIRACDKRTTRMPTDQEICYCKQQYAYNVSHCSRILIVLDDAKMGPKQT